MAIIQFETAYRHSHNFGIGIEGVSGSPMGKLVKGEILKVDGASGGFAQFAITRVSSTAELEQKLGIDATVSYGVGLFSASARLDFAKETRVQTESLFMAVTATVTLGKH